MGFLSTIGSIIGIGERIDDAFGGDGGGSSSDNLAGWEIDFRRMKNRLGQQKYNDYQSVSASKRNIVFGYYAKTIGKINSDPAYSNKIDILKNEGLYNANYDFMTVFNHYVYGNPLPSNSGGSGAVDNVSGGTGGATNADGFINWNSNNSGANMTSMVFFGVLAWGLTKVFKELF